MVCKCSYLPISKYIKFPKHVHTIFSVDNILFITFYIALSLFMHNFKKKTNGRKEKWYFVSKIVLTTVRKKCSSDREKTFEIRG